MSRRILKVLGANVIILAIGLLILEGVFGSWITPNYIARLNIPRDIQTNFDLSDIDSSEQTQITYTRDEFGLRGTFTDPSQIDVLTVGGSTTDQRYVDDQDTWQSVLQDQFHQNGNDVIIANAGVDGQSSYGHIKNLDWWFPNIPDLRPQFILYYVGLNDFDKDEGYTYDELLIEENSFRQRLRERSALYYMLRTIKGMYLARYVNKTAHGVDKTTDWTDVPLIQDYDGLMSERLDSYAARLRVLIDKTRSFGAVPILVTQPSRRYKVFNGEIIGYAGVGTYNGVEFNGVDYFHMLNRVNAVTMKTCLEHGGICIGLAKDIQLDDADFYDGSHMTNSGAKKVGVYLYSRLANYLD